MNVNFKKKFFFVKIKNEQNSLTPVLLGFQHLKATASTVCSKQTLETRERLKLKAINHRNDLFEASFAYTGINISLEKNDLVHVIERALTYEKSIYWLVDNGGNLIVN